MAAKLYDALVYVSKGKYVMNLDTELYAPLRLWHSCTPGINFCNVGHVLHCDQMSLKATLIETRSRKQFPCVGMAYTQYLLYCVIHVWVVCQVQNSR